MSKKIKYLSIGVALTTIAITSACIIWERAKDRIVKDFYFCDSTNHLATPLDFAIYKELFMDMSKSC